MNAEEKAEILKFFNTHPAFFSDCPHQILYPCLLFLASGFFLTCVNSPIRAHDLTIPSTFWLFPVTTVPHRKRQNKALTFCLIILSLVPNLSRSHTRVFTMNTNLAWTFHEKLELMKENSKSKSMVYIDQTFYAIAKNYLEVQDQKQQGTEADL